MTNTTQKQALEVFCYKFISTLGPEIIFIFSVYPPDDPTSYWKIPASGAYNWVAFDLGSEYTLTGVRIAGWYVQGSQRHALRPSLIPRL